MDEHKYTAFISLQPTGWNLELIPTGYYDDLIIKFLHKLSSGDRIHTELFVRLAHEMEMRPSYKYGWYSWQTNDSAIYINSWKHIVNLSRKYAPNVKWVWSPNRADEYAALYYPGDKYVDYVGLTLNNTLDFRKSFGDFYENEGQKKYLEKYNKPIIFGEVAEYSHNNNLRKHYIITIFDYLKSYDKCVGVVFLNQNISNERNYKFTNNKLILNTFVACARDYIYEK